MRRSPPWQALSRHSSARSSPAADSNMRLTQQVQPSALAAYRCPLALFPSLRRQHLLAIIAVIGMQREGCSK